MKSKGELHVIGVDEKSGERIAKIRIFPEFFPPLKGLQDFSNTNIIYWFHLRDTEEKRCTLQVVQKGYRDAPQVGVFARAYWTSRPSDF